MKKLLYLATVLIITPAIYSLQLKQDFVHQQKHLQTSIKRLNTQYQYPVIYIRKHGPCIAGMLDAIRTTYNTWDNLVGLHCYCLTCNPTESH